MSKKDGAQKKFYDLGWAIKVYGLGYGIQDTIEKKFFLLKANGNYDTFLVLRGSKDVI